MMSRPRIQPFRDDTIGSAIEFRNRLNETVRAINESPGRWVALRLPGVQSDIDVTVAPGFVVGGVVVAGVARADGGTLPAAAPWATDVRSIDGRTLFRVGGLAPAVQYVVNVVLFELEASR